MRTQILLAALAVTVSSCATKPLLDEGRVIDLTQLVDDASPHMPDDAAFVYERLRGTRDEFGRWLATGQFGQGEHVGTHLVAPLHLAESLRAVHEIPLPQLVAPIRVVEVRAAARKNRDYVIGTSDLAAHERSNGRVPIGAAVIFSTGWERFWDNPRRFIGLEGEDEAAQLHFPGISLELARALIERRVDLVGIDGPRLDPGLALDRTASRALAEANIPVLACLANLEALPDVGATLIALPLEIAGASGAPARVVAIVP